MLTTELFGSQHFFVRDVKGVWIMECNEEGVFIGREIKSLDHMIKRHIQHVINQNGFDNMTMMHSWILGYLYRQGDSPVYQRDIEKEFNVGRSSVTGMLQLMEKKGYIVRKQTSEDARLKQIIITGKGLEHIEMLEKDKNVLEEALTKDLTDEEIEFFIKIVRQMKHNLELI